MESGERAGGVCERERERDGEEEYGGRGGSGVGAGKSVGWALRLELGRGWAGGGGGVEAAPDDLKVCGRQRGQVGGWVGSKGPDPARRGLRSHALRRKCSLGLVVLKHPLEQRLGLATATTVMAVAVLLTMATKPTVTTTAEVVCRR